MSSKVVGVFALLALIFVAFSQVSARGFGQGGGCAACCNNQQRMFQPSYQDLDSNGDGQITEQEHALFREKRQVNRPGRGYQAQYNSNMFEIIDSNGDAVITADEFEAHQRSVNRSWTNKK